MNRSKKKMRRHMSLLLAMAMICIMFLAGGRSENVLADEATPASAVTMGTTTLETGYYVPAEGEISGPPAIYRVVDKVETAPADGNYLYFDKDTATMTVYGDVSLESQGPTPLSISGGTLTLTGSGNLKLENTSGYVVNGSGSLVTDNYTGNFTAVTATSNALYGLQSVKLLTTRKIEMKAASGPVIAECGDVILQGDSVNLSETSSSSYGFINTGGIVSVTATGAEGLAFSSAANYPLFYGNKITLSAPNGDITVENTASSSSGIIVAPNSVTISAGGAVSLKGEVNNPLLSVGTGDDGIGINITAKEDVTIQNTFSGESSSSIMAISCEGLKIISEEGAIAVNATTLNPVISSGAGDITIDACMGATVTRTGAYSEIPVIYGTGEKTGTILLVNGTGAESQAVLLTDGVETPAVVGDMNFKQTAASGNWKADAALETDGYTWDDVTNTLTLQNLYLNGALLLPGSANIVVKGNNTVDMGISMADNGANDTLSISSDGTRTEPALNVSSINVSCGNLIIDSVAVNAEMINQANTNGDGLFTIQNANVNAGSISWSSDEGMKLVGGNLIIGTATYPMFFINKIVMDDNSVIDLRVSINNYGGEAADLSGVEEYLPTGGYTIGRYNLYGSDILTILTPAGEPASNIILKKRLAQTTDTDNTSTDTDNTPSGTDQTTSESPKTGDSINAWKWVALAFVACAVMVIVEAEIVKRKKER